jgi:hypothetical protein
MPQGMVPLAFRSGYGEVTPETLTVTGTLQDAQLTKTSGRLADGWLSLLAPVPHGSGGRAALAMAWQILDEADQVVASYGSYFVRATATKIVMPQLQVRRGWKIKMIVAGSSSFASGSQDVSCRFVVSGERGTKHIPDPDLPGSCEGDVRRLTTANPAAGSDPARVTVGAQSHLRVVGLSGIFVTAVAAASRVVWLVYADAAAVAYAAGQAASSQTASQTVLNRGGTQTADGNHDTAGIPTDRSISIPNYILPAGHTFGIETQRIQGADDWGAVAYGVEEWAVVG